jgi:hypothetical protein
MLRTEFLKIGKAKLQCMQWCTLHSITTEEIFKASGFKVCYAIPAMAKICHFEFSPYFLYNFGVFEQLKEI